MHYAHLSPSYVAETKRSDVPFSIRSKSGFRKVFRSSQLAVSFLDSNSRSTACSAASKSSAIIVIPASRGANNGIPASAFVMSVVMAAASSMAAICLPITSRNAFKMRVLTHILLDGNLFRGHESPPALLHADSDSENRVRLIASDSMTRATSSRVCRPRR